MTGPESVGNHRMFRQFACSSLLNEAGCQWQEIRHRAAALHAMTIAKTRGRRRPVYCNRRMAQAMTAMRAPQNPTATTAGNRVMLVTKMPLRRRSSGHSRRNSTLNRASWANSSRKAFRQLLSWRRRRCVVHPAACSSCLARLTFTICSAHGNSADFAWHVPVSPATRSW